MGDRVLASGSVALLTMAVDLLLLLLLLHTPG
jgi:hypothetical protein